MIDVDALATHYRSLTDQQLERLTLQELAQLNPAALPVLGRELDRRGLVALRKAVTAQIEGLEPSEFNGLVTWFRNSPCPTCGEIGQPLNACSVQTLTDSTLVVGCPKCLQLAVDRASTKNTVGCVFAPFGWAVGPRAQARNAAAHLLARRPEPTDSFLTFVRDHQGPLVIAMRDEASDQRGGDDAG